MEQIVRVREAHEDGTATVFLQRESACSGDCHKCSGCGAAKEVMIFQVRNPIGARRGDLVVIESKTGPVMKAVGMFYVLPLVLFFAGFGLGMALSWRPGLLGGLGFVLGVIYAVWFDRHTAKKNDTVYTITGYAPGQGHC
jgi:sigma-E factor negative regulatory protein RseC